MLFDYIKVLIINNIKQTTMTPTEDKITKIFYLTDNFYQEFENLPLQGYSKEPAGRRHEPRSFLK